MIKFQKQEFVLVKPARLLEARTRFGVTRVPARLFRHLPGGCKSWYQDSTDLCTKEYSI